MTPFPIQIDVELNSTCNLSCPMCPISLEKSTTRDPSHTSNTLFQMPNLALDRFWEWLPQAVSWGLQSLKLNYINEPLMRKDLPEIIQKAKDLGVLDIYFSTNGLLLSPELCERLLKTGLDRIQISVDATTEDTYQKIRPGGSLQKVKENIFLLKQLRDSKKQKHPLIRVNFVKSEMNKHELEDFLTEWEGIVEMVGVQQYIPVPPLEASIPDKNRQPKSTLPDQAKHFRCSFPYKQLVVTSDGQILPCCTFWGKTMPLGTYLGPQSLKDAWDSPLMAELREAHKAGKFWKFPACVNCLKNTACQTNPS